MLFAASRWTAWVGVSGCDDSYWWIVVLYCSIESSIDDQLHICYSMLHLVQVQSIERMYWLLSNDRKRGIACDRPIPICVVWGRNLFKLDYPVWYAKLNHSLDQLVDFFSSGTSFSTFHKVKHLGLARESTRRIRKLEWPQEVICLLEIRSDCV